MSLTCCVHYKDNAHRHVLQEAHDCMHVPFGPLRSPVDLIHSTVDLMHSTVDRVHSTVDYVHSPVVDLRIVC